MINECTTQPQYVVVELCDTVLVDMIHIANFEYFSSSFKVFHVFAMDRSRKWKKLATFNAENTRDIQVNLSLLALSAYF